MYATAYIVFTIAAAALCYITCVAPFTFFEKKLWNQFACKNSATIALETSKFKRKESKPTIIDIDLVIEKAKRIDSLKTKLEQQMETKTFQT